MPGRGRKTAMDKGRPKGSTKGGKVKKVKDVNRPKRATTAYFCYLSHCRHKEKEAGRSISKVGLFMQEVSEKWRKLSTEEKKKFENEASKDKERYLAEMANYKGPSAKKPKDETKPKRAQGSYFFFLPVFRKRVEGKDIAHTEKIRLAGEAWRNMTEEQKAPYQKMAKEDQARYAAEIEAWRKAKDAVPANNGAKEDEHDDDEEEEDEDEEEEDDDEDDE